MEVIFFLLWVGTITGVCVLQQLINRTQRKWRKEYTEEWADLVHRVEHLELLSIQDTIKEAEEQTMWPDNVGVMIEPKD